MVTAENPETETAETQKPKRGRPRKVQPVEDTPTITWVHRDDASECSYPYNPVLTIGEDHYCAGEGEGYRREIIRRF